MTIRGKSNHFIICSLYIYDKGKGTSVLLSHYFRHFSFSFFNETPSYTFNFYARNLIVLWTFFVFVETRLLIFLNWSEKSIEIPTKTILQEIGTIFCIKQSKKWKWQILHTKTKKKPLENAGLMWWILKRIRFRNTSRFPPAKPMISKFMQMFVHFLWASGECRCW